MLSSLEWQTLKEQRRIARLTMFYKIHNNLVATLMPLHVRGHTSPTPTENTLAYVIPYSTDYLRQSFFPRTAKEWNKLPQSVVQASTLDAFQCATICA